MSIKIIDENIYTENAQKNLEELIGKTKGKKNILLVGENIYCMSNRPATEVSLYKKARTDFARKSRGGLQVIRYPDGSLRIELRDLQIGWYIPKESTEKAELTWEEAKEYEQKIRSGLKEEKCSAMYVVNSK